MTSSDLKIIACLTMLIDHIGVVLFPNIIILRIIGRLAFPIFCFLLVEGYFCTKNIYKYLYRLGLFAIISEIPFDLAFMNSLFYLGHQNIFFTLFIGILAIYLYDNNKDRDKLFSVICVILFALINKVMCNDYQAFGIIIIFSFYYFRSNFRNLIILITVFNFIMICLQMVSSKYILWSILIQVFQLGALPLIYFYNGKRGLSIKYLFYLFYPAHLMLLYIINNIIV